MHLKTPKLVWEKLQGEYEYEGNNRFEAVKLLTLKREFELMKDDESVKDYSGRLMNVVNQVRLLGVCEAFKNQKIVEKLWFQCLKSLKP